MAFDIDEALGYVVEREGSDLHVKVPSPLVVTGRVQDLILNPQEIGRLTEVIAEGEYHGMQTFDQALLSITSPRATSTLKPRSRWPRARTDFKLMLDAQGRRASGIEQVVGARDGKGSEPEEPARTVGAANPADPLHFVKH